MVRRHQCNKDSLFGGQDEKSVDEFMKQYGMPDRINTEVFAPYILHTTHHTLHPTPYDPHPAPYTLHPTPYILFPTRFTLHTTHYPLHPTPYTLHPASYTPTLSPWC